MVTRKQIDAAKPEATVELARHWMWTAAQMETAADDYVGYLAKPGGQSWDGETAEATQHRGGDDRRAIIAMADDITKAGNDTINTAAESVMPALKNVRQLIENTEKLGGFTVHDDLSVTYEPSAGTSEERAQQCRNACARFSEQIKDAANTWWAADQHAGELIDRMAAALPANFNPLAGKAPGQIPSGTATAIDYKKQYPKKTAPSATDPAAIDPKVAALVPGLDPNATKPAAGPQGSLPELLDAASKAKPPIDPKVGSLTDNLLRIDPTMAARQSHVEKIPGRALDPNSPAGKATVDGLRGLYQSQGLPAAQVEAKVQEALKAGGQDQYAVKFADPNAPSATPSEHVSRDFGEQFNKFTNGISDAATRTIDGQIEQGKILTGQAGPGAPGVAEAWREVGINAAHQVHELTTDPLAAPKMGIEQAKDFINSPSEFIGKNIIHGTEALATGGIGGEAAAGARGLLGDLTGTEGRALTHGIEDATPSHHTPPVDHPALGDGHHDVDFSTDGPYHSHDVGDIPTEQPRAYNDNIEAYPRAYNPGTGEEMPFPAGDLDRVPGAERSDWTKMDRYYYIKQWHDMGYTEPPGGWDIYDIHHIRPREFGGDNSFENLIPVPRPVHNQRITPWWNNYGQG
ncbi:HNH endonuclease signature motif containing protein [Mycobacteroides chelonae]